MGMEKEIDLYNSDGSELDFTEEPEDKIGEVLDERDYIQPLKEAREVSLDPSGNELSLETNDQEEEDIQMSPIATGDQADKSQTESEKEIPMNAQCAIFAESEVVGLIHAKTSKPDISKAIHDAIASRIVSMIRRIGVNEDVVIVGGVGRNPGFIDACRKLIQEKLLQLLEELNKIVLKYSDGVSNWLKIWNSNSWYALQEDMAYNLSPNYFKQFVLPDLTEQTENMEYSIYHLDGVNQYAKY